MMTRLFQTVAAIAAGAAMAASAAAEPAKDKDAKAADPRLGEEVNSICFASTINGWRSIKGEDDAVLLERGVNDWYRVNLSGACDERLFRSAIAIGLESSPSGGCVSRGDVIIVEDTPGFTRRCMITRMYKWDEKAEDEKAEGESE